MEDEAEICGLRGFTIPKRSAQSGLLRELETSSREWDDVIKLINHCYFQPKDSPNVYKYDRIFLVNNAKLNRDFEAFRSDLRRTEQSISSKDLQVSYGFLACTDEDEHRAICEHGVQIGNIEEGILGKASMGIHLSRFSDILTSAPPYPGSGGCFVIFKILKGRQKGVPLDSEDLEPTPKHECHVPKINVGEMTKEVQKNLWKTAQVYLYEYDSSGEIVKKPRTVCPYAVVFYEAKEFSDALERQIISQSHILWEGSLVVGNKILRDVQLCSNFFKLLPFGLTKEMKIEKFITYKSCVNFAPMKELLDGKQMLIKKKELRLTGGLFASYFRIGGAGPEAEAKFGNLVKKIHKNRAVGVLVLPEGSSVFLIPISHLAMDLGIPPVKEFAKCLHCVSFNYRSLGNLSIGSRDMFDVPTLKDQQVMPQYALSKQKLSEYLDALYDSQETMFQSALRDPRVKQSVSVAVSDYSDFSPSDEVSLTDSNVERLQTIRAGINDAISDVSYEDLPLDKPILSLRDSRKRPPLEDLRFVGGASAEKRPYIDEEPTTSAKALGGGGLTTATPSSPTKIPLLFGLPSTELQEAASKDVDLRQDFRRFISTSRRPPLIPKPPSPPASEEPRHLPSAVPLLLNAGLPFMPNADLSLRQASFSANLQAEEDAMIQNVVRRDPRLQQKQKDQRESLAKKIEEIVLMRQQRQTYPSISTVPHASVMDQSRQGQLNAMAFAAEQDAEVSSTTDDNNVAGPSTGVVRPVQDDEVIAGGSEDAKYEHPLIQIHRKVMGWIVEQDFEYEPSVILDEIPADTEFMATHDDAGSEVPESATDLKRLLSQQNVAPSSNKDWLFDNASEIWNAALNVVSLKENSPVRVINEPPRPVPPPPPFREERMKEIPRPVPPPPIREERVKDVPRPVPPPGPNDGSLFLKPSHPAPKTAKSRSSLLGGSKKSVRVKLKELLDETAVSFFEQIDVMFREDDKRNKYESKKLVKHQEKHEEKSRIKQSKTEKPKKKEVESPAQALLNGFASFQNGFAGELCHKLTQETSAKKKLVGKEKEVESENLLQKEIAGNYKHNGISIDTPKKPVKSVSVEKLVEKEKSPIIKKNENFNNENEIPKKSSKSSSIERPEKNEQLFKKPEPPIQIKKRKKIPSQKKVTIKISKRQPALLEVGKQLKKKALKQPKLFLKSVVASARMFARFSPRHRESTPIVAKKFTPLSSTTQFSVQKTNSKESKHSKASKTTATESDNEELKWPEPNVVLDDEGVAKPSAADTEVGAGDVICFDSKEFEAFNEEYGVESSGMNGLDGMSKLSLLDTVNSELGNFANQVQKIYTKLGYDQKKRCFRYFGLLQAPKLNRRELLKVHLKVDLCKNETFVRMITGQLGLEESVNEIDVETKQKLYRKVDHAVKVMCRQLRMENAANLLGNRPAKYEMRVGKNSLEKAHLNPLRSVDLVPENNLVWNFMEEFVAESLASLNGEIFVQDENLPEEGEILPESLIYTYLPHLLFNYSIYPMELQEFSEAVQYCYDDLIYRMGMSSGLAIVVKNTSEQEEKVEEATARVVVIEEPPKPPEIFRKPQSGTEVCFESIHEQENAEDYLLDLDGIQTPDFETPEPRFNVAKLPTVIAAKLPVDLPQGPPAGVLIPDSMVLNNCDVLDLERILETFSRWKAEGTANWLMKLHSQVVLHLADMKKNLQESSVAYNRINRILLTLTKYRKKEVVELMQHHYCDKKARSTTDYLTCITELKQNLGNANAYFVLLTNMDPSGEAGQRFVDQEIFVLNFRSFLDVFINKTTTPAT